MAGGLDTQLSSPPAALIICRGLAKRSLSAQGLVQLALPSPLHLRPMTSESLPAILFEYSGNLQLTVIEPLFRSTYPSGRSRRTARRGGTQRRDA